MTKRLLRRDSRAGDSNSKQSFQGAAELSSVFCDEDKKSILGFHTVESSAVSDVFKMFKMWVILPFVGH